MITQTTLLNLGDKKKVMNVGKTFLGNKGTFNVGGK